jgi:hypothetical protein
MMVFVAHKPCHTAPGKTIEITHLVASMLLKKPSHPTVFSIVENAGEAPLAGRDGNRFQERFSRPDMVF